ncbi:MAG: hypothetical protein KF866_10500 [Phycisphaeraceae bacterium]|nr:hypothetical protein [Phycisphaeraceae bacterium]
MPADNIEYSADYRHYLYYWPTEGGWHIRVFHNGTTRTLLSLTHPNGIVTRYRFDPDAPLLHVILARTDRSLVNYPATIDLDTGYFYVNARPSASTIPSGVAKDLERLITEGISPTYFDPKNPPEPWIPPDDLDPLGYLKPKQPTQPAPEPEPDAEPIEAPPPPDPWASVTSDSGLWRIEPFPIVRDHPHPLRGVRILSVPDGRPILDSAGLLAHINAQFHPDSHLIDLHMTTEDGAKTSYCIDLDAGMFWETSTAGRTVSGYPLSILDDVLRNGKPASLAAAWGISTTVGPSVAKPPPQQPAHTDSGNWRIDIVPVIGPSGVTRQGVRIVHNESGATPVDTTHLDADARAEFHPKGHVCNLILTFPGSGVRAYCLDLYSGIFWGIWNIVEGRTTAYNLSSLPKVLAFGDHACADDGWCTYLQPAPGVLPGHTPPVKLRPPASVADATVAARVASFSAAAHIADLPIGVVHGIAFAAAIAAGTMSSEEAIKALHRAYPGEPFWK